MIYIKGDSNQMDKIEKILKHIPDFYKQKRFLRDLAVLSLRINRERIKAQKMGDDSPMKPRKQSGKMKDKPMFQLIRMRKHYKISPIISKYGENFVKIQFSNGFLAKIAQLHQEGISQFFKDKKSGKTWEIPRPERDILIINDNMKEAINSFLNLKLKQLTK